MELHYSKNTEEIINIVERLTQMSLAFKRVESTEDIEPSIVDGSKKYPGIDNMNIYLDQLDREKEQWYYCNC